jgi:hypothetical protein
MRPNVFAAMAAVAVLVGGGLLSTAVPGALRAPAADAAPPAPAPSTGPCNTTKQDTPITPALLASGLPCDVNLRIPADIKDVDALQRAFDYYSWLTFIALNTPPGGTIGKGPGAGGDAPTSWEHWQDLFSTMRPGGAPPPAFGHPLPPPSICPAGPGGAIVVQMIGKTPETLQKPDISITNLPLRTGPVIDRNGHYARFQILLNQPMFTYIVNNKLYSKAVQQNFASPVSFPAGNIAAGSVGAIVIKASWKVLDPKDPNDAPSRFHSLPALVYTPASDSPPVRAQCHKALLGLVGLHIVHKTSTHPQWLWTTFEHVDNVPTPAEAKAPPPGRHWNFFDPACPAAKCAWNAEPPRPWDPSKDPFPNGFRSQIVRTTTLPPAAVKSAADLNPQFRKILGSSVWSNYELISTQWPSDRKSTTDPTGKPFPLFLANATLETYDQGSPKLGNVPLSTSSCMACHGNATSLRGRPSDFTFVLTHAH